MDGSVATVQAFAAPSQVSASDVTLVYTCDAQAPDGVNVAMFVGRYAVPLPERLDVLVRIDRQPSRRAEWVTNQDTLALPAFFDEVSNVLGDLRSGTVFAARLFLFEGVDDASQPTFQFDVSGFASVESQLACGRAGGASDDPFATGPTSPSAPSSPAAPVAPVAPASPATPAAPSVPARGSTPPATPWEISGTGSGTFMIASDEQAGAVVATCNAEGFPVAFVYTDGTPAAGREFSVRFANGDLLAVTKIEDDLYDKYGITAGGFPLLGGTGLLVAGAYPSGFDVTAVFPDGSEVLLVRAAGGDDFFAAWGALPCNESFFPLATPAAPSAPPATSLGSWSIEGDGTLLSFGDARGRFFGWICGQGDQDPVIYLELPGVAVAKSADGTVSFSFARANGTGGSVTWKFVGAGGWFVTDDVATNDLTVRLLPDVGSTSWNDLNVTVDGQGVVLTVDGDFRMVELYWQLTCVR